VWSVYAALAIWISVTSTPQEGTFIRFILPLLVLIAPPLVCVSQWRVRLDEHGTRSAFGKEIAWRDVESIELKRWGLRFRSGSRHVDVRHWIHKSAGEVADFVADRLRNAGRGDLVKW